MSNKIKQVIVMRHDLHMRAGKQTAQGSHASLAFLTRRLQKARDNSSYLASEKDELVGLDEVLTIKSIEWEWIDTSFAKVVCRVDSEEELMDIYSKAEEAGLEVHLVTDSGKTEFHDEPTRTCLAIGPDLSKNIDPITGHLKLM